MDFRLGLTSIMQNTGGVIVPLGKNRVSMEWILRSLGRISGPVE